MPVTSWLSSAGFAGYIVKPIDIDAFPDLVRGFCPPGLIRVAAGS